MRTVPLAWNPTVVRLEDFRFAFSGATERELRDTLASVCQRQGHDHVEDLPLITRDLPAFQADVTRMRHRLDGGQGLVLIRPMAGLHHHTQVLLSWVLAVALGTPLVQNAAGDRLIEVYDRDRTARMASGARYHQTHEGGFIHTDNVNTPDPWDYLVFSCIQPSFVGGESIFVNGDAVYEHLSAYFPDALVTLQKPFWWEYRGIAEQLYQAPVIDHREGRPTFRYLRPYLESAHARAGEPLSHIQTWALDVLDSLLDLSTMQLRYAMHLGETYVVRDNQILHGRTCFADRMDADMGSTHLPHEHAVTKRYFTRLWIRGTRSTQQ